MIVELKPGFLIIIFQFKIHAFGFYSFWVFLRGAVFLLVSFLISNSYRFRLVALVREPGPVAFRGRRPYDMKKPAHTVSNGNDRKKNPQTNKKDASYKVTVALKLS